MASFLVIKNGSTLNSYTLKTTHTNTPFLRVGQNGTGYLDLTTKTTGGLQLKIKVNNNTYRPLQTYTTTASRGSTYTTTTGYSGRSTYTSSKSTKITGSKRSYSGERYSFTTTIGTETCSYEETTSFVSNGSRSYDTWYYVFTETSNSSFQYAETNTRWKTRLSSLIRTELTSSTNSRNGLSRDTVYWSRTSSSFRTQYQEFSRIDPSHYWPELYLSTHYWNTTIGAKVSTYSFKVTDSYSVSSSSSSSTSGTGSSYRTSASPGSLVSTTALTESRTRSSQYNTTTEV